MVLTVQVVSDLLSGIIFYFLKINAFTHTQL